MDNIPNLSLEELIKFAHRNLGNIMETRDFLDYLINLLIENTSNTRDGRCREGWKEIGLLPNLKEIEESSYKELNEISKRLYRLEELIKEKQKGDTKK